MYVIYWKRKICHQKEGGTKVTRHRPDCIRPKYHTFNHAADPVRLIAPLMLEHNLMNDTDNKVNHKYWDQAVQMYQATELSLPDFCKKHSIDQVQFERWLRLFAYTSKDTEEKRAFKESNWMFQPLKVPRYLLAYRACFQWQRVHL